MAGYNVPRSEIPGGTPPRAQSDIIHLSDLPSAYQMAKNGMVNLSEQTTVVAQLGLGTESHYGDYVLVPVFTGNTSEGISAGYALGIDLAGQGNGSVQFIDGQPVVYGVLQIASQGGVTYDPTRADVDATIPEPAITKDADTEQATTTQVVDENGETAVEIAYGTQDVVMPDPVTGVYFQVAE